MKRCLITGFEPFGGETVNPSWDAVNALPDTVGQFRLTKLRLPVVFGKAAELTVAKAEEVCPDVILCIGQAGGRDAVTPELVGINLRYASIPDNDGNQPKDEPVSPDGESGLFSTLPVRNLADAISAAGIPSRVSYSAGAYVCNDLLYTLLSRCKNTETKVGFIHVPYTAAQNKQPALESEQIVKALTVALEALD